MEKELSILGLCPVCDCSWRGASFRWIYREADRNAMEAEIRELRERNMMSDCPLSDEELRRFYPKAMPNDMIELAAAQHGLSNQSRVMLSEDGAYLQCPSCGSRFAPDDFADFQRNG